MNQYRKVAFYTLGCKLNFSETSTIARLFEDDGFARVDFSEWADVYIINTCSVTQNADKECKRIVKKGLNLNPKAFVIVVGCYAQLKPDEIAQIPGVDMVLGANEKFNILAHLDSLEKKEQTTIFNTEIKEVQEYTPAFSSGDRTRTFLKVQDGCDYFCAFCTIPLARGKSRSANIATTVKVAEEAVAEGAKEIVLTGVNIGDFGVGTDENFYGLVQELDKVEGVERFRISSIEPNLLSNEIIDFVAKSDKFVPHFHIPLQSGSNEILESMRRKYKVELYQDRIETIKQKMPDCCIGVDVIVGFPGESDTCFEETYAFLTELDVSYLHVFTYSERDNTTAAKQVNDVVPKSVRAERSKRLRILSEKKKRAFYQTQVGKSGTVLFEQEETEGFMHGFSENYIKVKVPYNETLVNKLAHVSFEEIDGEGTMKCQVLEKVKVG